MEDLPSTSDEWARLVEKHGLGQTSLHSMVTASASRIEIKQFLLLRVLYRHKKGIHLMTACRKSKAEDQLLSNDIWHKADNFLKSLASWKQYLKFFGSSSPPEGTFALAQYYQRLTNRNPEMPPDNLVPKVLFSPRPQRTTNNPYSSIHFDQRTPTRQGRFSYSQETPGHPDIADMSALHITPGTDMISLPSPWSPLSGDPAKYYRAIEDEQIVNTALFVFLNALTMHHPDFRNEWTLYRHPFVLRDLQGMKVYEARVDGLLRTKPQQQLPARAQALVEVKPFLRYSDENVLCVIRMQEAAQMAAWISQHPPPAGSADGQENYRRLLISQDRNEIYVTIASFDHEYVRYLREEIPITGSFLHMTEYGPFDVNVMNHMRYLGVIMLAFSLQGGVR